MAGRGSGGWSLPLRPFARRNYFHIYRVSPVTNHIRATPVIIFKQVYLSATPRLIQYATMGAIRKIPRTRQMPDFRRRLQRALSLSSSESEYSPSPSRSLSGDTTEEEASMPSNKNDKAVPQLGDPPSTHDHGVLPSPQYGELLSQPRDSNVLTLTCLAELVRVTPYRESKVFANR
jgi:hypothetical protein